MNEKMVNKYKEIIRDGQGTLVIIAINIIIFIAINIIPSLGAKLLLNHEISLILEKPWTLVTVFFSHQVLIHIILNMGLFFYFGSRVEKITNAKTVVMVYLIAGLMGSLAFPLTGLVIERPGLIAGASAAVMGVVSAFAVMRPSTVILKSKAMWWVLALIIFSVFSAIVIPQSLDSGVAHLTGIFVGLISGYCIKNKGNIKSK
ncbi:rhomboid family intramembrane serine protease [Alkalibacterium sp. 20]|uniref:rhomboid family intramembrane serine protease n=1 Tax=Alkalibacterium sp. 20 TaxID=1798803 RepID=UPI0009000854|nr:rhomboid family intramembrane serine protease [Alkalibacterium sp. 20]OJF91544.1 rhomboid family intramembrane serine protease [Alkalibacterium sp. 20]